MKPYCMAIGIPTEKQLRRTQMNHAIVIRNGILLRISLLSFVTILSFSANAVAAPSMSDAEARSLIETTLNNFGRVIPLGPVTVLRQEGNTISFGRDGISIQTGTHQEIKGWEKVGIISISADEKYENYKKGNEFSWKQWNQQTQQKIDSMISVTPTELGKNHIDPQSTKRITISQGLSTVIQIAKNEERKIGIDDYRLVMATYNVQLNPLFIQWQKVMGKEFSEERKNIMLFKWDPFKNKWNLVAIDDANANEEFNSSNVANKLR